MGRLGAGARNAVWLVLMAATLFLILLPISSYVAAVPVIRDEWGLSNTEVGLVFSALFVSYALAALFVIPMTDRLRLRWIIVGSAVLFAAANLLFPLVARHLVTGLILRAVAGVGLVGVYMPGLRVVSERYSGGARGWAVGLWVTAFYLANSGSLAITGGLMAWLDWTQAYSAMSLVSAAGIPLAFLLLRSYREPALHSSSGKLDLSVLKDPSVRYLVLGYSLHAVQLQSVRAWLPGFLLAALVAGGADADTSVAKAAAVAGAALTVGAVGPLIGGILSDRWGRANTAAAIFAVSGGCSWLVGWTVGMPWAFIVALSFVYGWSISADSAIYSTGLTEVADRGRLGSIQAVQAFLGFTGGAVGPVVFGGILDISAESIRWGLGFSALGLMAVVAVPGLLRLRSLPQSRGLAGGKG